MSDLILSILERYTQAQLNLIRITLDNTSLTEFINLELGTHFSEEEALAFIEMCLEPIE